MIERNSKIENIKKSNIEQQACKQLIILCEIEVGMWPFEPSLSHTVLDLPHGSYVVQNPSHSSGVSSTGRTDDYPMGIMGHSDR